LILVLVAPEKEKDLNTARHHDRAPGGLIRQAPEGKKDASQKKERGEGQQNKN
jgi:hypothetical protein